jgi:hypothetical protein
LPIQSPGVSHERNVTCQHRFNLHKPNGCE